MSDEMRNDQSREQWFRDRIKELEAKLAAAEKALDAVGALINESTGVYGLHLNGDPAPWEELRVGGRFEEWLVDFDAAKKDEEHE